MTEASEFSKLTKDAYMVTSLEIIDNGIKIKTA